MAGQTDEGRDSFPKRESTGEGSNADNGGEGQPREQVEGQPGRAVKAQLPQKERGEGRPEEGGEPREPGGVGEPGADARRG